MRFPDAVTILRATTADEYGNPARSWTAPEETAAFAFITHGAEASKALFPPATDVRAGDRVRNDSDGAIYAVDAARTARSPSRDVLRTAVLTRVEG